MCLAGVFLKSPACFLNEHGQHNFWSSDDRTKIFADLESPEKTTQDRHFIRLTTPTVEKAVWVGRLWTPHQIPCRSNMYLESAVVEQNYLHIWNWLEKLVKIRHLSGLFNPKGKKVVLLGSSWNPRHVSSMRMGNITFEAVMIEQKYLQI